MWISEMVLGFSWIVWFSHEIDGILWFSYWLWLVDLVVQQDWASGLPLSRNIELLLRWVLILLLQIVNCVMNVNWILILVTFRFFCFVMKMIALGFNVLTFSYSLNYLHKLEIFLGAISNLILSLRKRF